MGTQYVGRVSVGVNTLRVHLVAEGDQCSCAKLRPDFGACQINEDFGSDRCDCVPCIERVEVTGGPSPVSYPWDSFAGLQATRFHGGQPGTELVLTIFGCLGPATIGLTLPEAMNIPSLEAPTESAPNEVLVRWAPAGIFDEVFVTTEGLRTASCVDADSGSITLPIDIERADMVALEGSLALGAHSSSIADVGLYETQITAWP